MSQILFTAFEACVANMHEEFKKRAGEGPGERLAHRQETFISKMLKFARRNPTIGGHQSLAGYISKSQLHNLFQPFLDELCKELQATGTGTFSSPVEFHFIHFFFSFYTSFCTCTGGENSLTRNEEERHGISTELPSIFPPYFPLSMYMYSSL